jgi:hypothetical protein
MPNLSGHNDKHVQIVTQHDYDNGQRVQIRKLPSGKLNMSQIYD